MIRACILLILLLQSYAHCHAADWPQWRGPLLNGATPETNLPPQLSRQQHLLWSAPLPGRSGATPIVHGNHIFVSSPDPDRNLLLLCLDRTTGSVRWQRQTTIGDRTQGKNNMASPSPVTDGQLVFALFGTSDLVAFDFDGNEKWRRRLREDLGGFAHMFLYGASPLLLSNRLYIPVLQRNPPTYSHSVDLKPERKSWLLCLDTATGRTLWQQERTTPAREEAMEAYTTPLPIPTPRGTEIVLVGANAITAHHPLTGTESWRFSGLNLTDNPGGRIVPSPVATPGLLFAIGPKREQIVALRTDTASATNIPLAWSTNQFIPDVPTPLLYQGRLFVLDGDRQVMTCYEPASGQVLWQGRLGVREIFYSSPTGADGRIYCLGEEGTLVVLSAGEPFQVLSTIPFGEGPCMSSVTIANRRLYLRTARSLLALGQP